MTRSEWFLSILIISCTCAFLIWSKFLFSSTLLQIQIIESDMSKKKQLLKTLKLEWIKLNSPEKLKKLAEKYFPDYVPAYSKQTSKQMNKVINYVNYDIEENKVKDRGNLQDRNDYNEKQIDVDNKNSNPNPNPNVEKKKKKLDLSIYLDNL